MPTKIGTKVVQTLGFEIVDRSEVPEGPAGRGQLSPASEALLDGKTIFMEGPNRSARFARMAKPRGYRVRTRTGTRNDQKGTYVWLEPTPVAAD
jgi:hypothetical protein